MTFYTVCQTYLNYHRRERYNRLEKKPSRQTDTHEPIYRTNIAYVPLPDALSLPKSLLAKDHPTFTTSAAENRSPSSAAAACVRSGLKLEIPVPALHALPLSPTPPRVCRSKIRTRRGVAI